MRAQDIISGSRYPAATPITIVSRRNLPRPRFAYRNYCPVTFPHMSRGAGEAGPGQADAGDVAGAMAAGRYAAGTGT